MIYLSRYIMKTIVYILYLLFILSVPAISIEVPEPCPYRMSSEPCFILIPDSEVYVAPAIMEYDLFYFHHWFWQKFGLKWYRTRAWNARWQLYAGIPDLVIKVPVDWRQRYVSHSWDGKPWIPKLIAYGALEQFQRSWHPKYMRRLK